jgi:hypothetical protein
MRWIVFVVAMLGLSAPLWLKDGGGQPYAHVSHYLYPPNIALAYVRMAGLGDGGTQQGMKSLQRWQDAEGNWHYSDAKHAAAGSETVSANDLGNVNFLRKDGKDHGDFMMAGYVVLGLLALALLWSLPVVVRTLFGLRLPQRAARDKRDPGKAIDYVPPGG